MKTLTPDTKVRLALWSAVTYATFNTVRGCAARDGRDVEAAVDRAKAKFDLRTTKLTTALIRQLNSEAANAH